MQSVFSPNATPVGNQSRTYRIRTDTVTTVKEQTVKNSITTTLVQSLYGQPGPGNNTILIEQVAFFQTDKSPLAILLTDLNPVNERLLVDLSSYGDLLTLRNRSQIDERWHQIKPMIVAKYGRTREGVAFIQNFEQQLRSEALLSNFQHKGPYGVLLPGLFGLHGAVRDGVSTRNLTGFFGALDLPLLLHSEVKPSLTYPGGRELQVTAQPDPNHFDTDKLRALAQEGMDMVNFRAEHRISGKETYTLAADHSLMAARQTISAAIEGFYHHYTQHELTLL